MITEEHSFPHIDTSQAPFSIFKEHQELFIKSNFKELDNYLSGGLHKGMITQLYGQAGSGKSQIAMLYTIGAISRGIPVCFLATDKELSWNRFTSLAYNTMNEAELEEHEKLLTYKRMSDFEQSFKFIEQTLRKIKEHNRGGLLIIDSVHTFIMNCLEHYNIENDPFQKSKKQAKVVSQLRWMAKISGTAVLLVNHAADIIDKRRGSSGRTVVPTLGNAWEQNMDQNIYLTRKGQIRILSIITSPKCAKLSKQRFRLDNSGFTWISEQGIQYID